MDGSMLEKILAPFESYPPHLHRGVLQCWTFRHRRAPRTEKEQRRAVFEYLLRPGPDAPGASRLLLGPALEAWLTGEDEHSRAWGPLPRLAAVVHRFQPDLRRRFDLATERGYKGFFCHLALTLLPALRWPETLLSDAVRRVLWEPAPGVSSPSAVGVTRGFAHLARGASPRPFDVTAIGEYSQLLLHVLSDVERGALPGYALSPAQLEHLSRPVRLANARVRLTGLTHHLAVERGMVAEQDLARPDVAAQLERQFPPLLARMKLPAALRAAHGIASPPVTSADARIVEAPARVVTVIGALSHGSGLGAATRACVEALHAAAVPVEVLNLQASYGTNGESAGGDRVSRVRGDVNIIHFNPDVLVENLAGIGLEAFEGRYNVGMFWWETSRACFAHRLGAGLVDEIWVATPYLRDVFREVTDRPVHVVGLPVPRIEDVAWASRGYFGLDDGPFTFVFTFDGASRFTRKNPLGAVRAFQRAFPGDPGVRLVLKTQNTGALAPADQRLYARIRRIAAADRRITVIDESFSSNEVHALISVCDAYVGLQRSEGFGLGMAEAMSLGVPVVATADSGNAVFTTEAMAWPVRSARIPVPAAEFVYDEPGQEWAEPDLDHAAERMREVRADPGRAGKIARAREHVGRTFSALAVGRAYAERLADIRARLARGERVAA
jgi:glycosyltransferase involved in cell wall biosynthesis